MPKAKADLPEPGARVGGWIVQERLADVVRTDRRQVLPQYRVRCAGCRKELVLKFNELHKRNCTDCQRNQLAATSPLAEPEFTEMIQYAYRVRLRICAALGAAPVPFETFAAQMREHPDLLLEAPPLKTAADYEQRDFSPLYTAGE